MEKRFHPKIYAFSRGDRNVARVLHIDLTRPNHSWEGKDSNESFVFLNEAEGKFRERKVRNVFPWSEKITPPRRGDTI